MSNDTFTSYRSFDTIVGGICDMQEYGQLYSLLSRRAFTRVSLTELSDGRVEFDISRRRIIWGLASIRGELKALQHNRTQVTAKTVLYGVGFWITLMLAVVAFPMISLLFEEYRVSYLFVTVSAFSLRIVDTFLASGYLLRRFGRIVE